MRLLKEKRGTAQPINATRNAILQIIFVIIGLLALSLAVFYFTSTCNQSSFTITEKITETTPDFLGKPLTNLLEKSVAGKSIGDRMDKRSAQVTNLLGYGRDGKQSFCLFIFDLTIGLLVGLWIWLLTKLYAIERASSRRFLKLGAGASKNSWLEAIGRGGWKIPLIGVGYAVLMQVPLLNAAIDIICFDFLAKGFWFDTIIRSLLIAFYIGVGPTAYDEYKRYKIKKAYQYALIRKNYESQAQRISSTN